MSAEAAPAGNEVRRAIDALADRVDMLASIVRETAGSISASRGDVASLDRRVQERIGDDTKRSAAALTSLRGELDALRAFVEQAPDRSVTVSAAASDPLNETVATLSDRLETLAEIIRSTAGQLVAEQSRISILSTALAKGDEHVEARLSEIQRDLRVVSEQATQAAQAAAATPAAPVDPEFGVQFERQVGALAERVDFLSGTVAATAGKLAVTDGELAKAEQHSRREAERSGEVVRSLREDLAALNERLAVDPLLKERVGDLVETVQALGDRVGTLSGIVGETAGRRAGRETEIAALDERLGEVGARVDDVARELRLEIEALAVTSADGVVPVVDAPLLEGRMEFFAEQLARLEVVVDDAAGAAEQVGIELRGEIAALAAAVERERIDLEQATHEWEARRAALEDRMDELAVFAASTAERGVDEVGRALHTLAERLERLEHDRQAVASEATNAESTWAVERVELEARLDAIAAAITEERPQAPEVAHLIAELSGRLARMEGERETVADLAALADTWTTELAALEARVDEGLSTLEAHRGDAVEDGAIVASGVGLAENLDELTQRIEDIERDRDAVRDELTRTAASWGAERASLQERVSELAARIVTGPIPGSADSDGAVFGQSPQELDQLRIGVEGLRMRLAYHEKTVSDLAGSRGVVQRLDELTARLDQLAAIVAAGTTGTTSAGNANPVPASALSLGADASGLISRLDEADRLRRETREKMLDQMEKIASRIDWRLQRLESAGVETPSGVN